MVKNTCGRWSGTPPRLSVAVHRHAAAMHSYRVAVREQHADQVRPPRHKRERLDVGFEAVGFHVELGRGPNAARRCGVSSREAGFQRGTGHDARSARTFCVSVGNGTPCVAHSTANSRNSCVVTSHSLPRAHTTQPCCPWQGVMHTPDAVHNAAPVPNHRTSPHQPAPTGEV